MHRLRFLLASFSLLACMFLAVFPANAQQSCAPDINGDGLVNGADLAAVLGAWGACATPCGADTNADGVVDGSDLADVLAAWGGTCEPTIAGVSPASGPTAGGTVITVTGTGLAGVQTVSIGGVAATGVMAIDASTVTAVTPPGTAGTQEVTVTTPGGAATFSGGFTYGPAPTVTSLTPSQGPSSGGTIVSVLGSGFVAPLTVTFGGVPASSFVITDSSTITAVAPPSDGGVVDLSVTTSFGSGSSEYYYTAAPSISSVLPNSGPQSGGTFVEITGEHFYEPTHVFLNSTAAGTFNPVNLEVLSPTKLRFVTPSFAVLGDYVIKFDVVVQTPWGSATAPAAFTPVKPPTLASLQPAVGPPMGETIVKITGTRLTGATGVTIGGIPATGVVVESDTTIRAVTSGGALGAQTVAVTTPGGTVELANGFTYAMAVPAWATALELAPDPAVVTDPSLREAIYQTQFGWRVQDNATGIEMVLVPPATFEMGCTPSNAHNCYSVENPVHPVTVSQPLYFARYETTQAQWTAVLGSNPSHFTKANGFPGSDTRPVESVSWDDVQGFLSSTSMRLPTEAEWEYACRAGTTTAFHGWAAQPAGTNDDSQLGAIAWYEANSNGRTQPVGGLASNGFGLFDMAGNVCEWCADWYSDFYYSTSPGVDPQGPGWSPYGWRVLRGGNYMETFGMASNYARSSCRNANDPTIRLNNQGFRVVRDAAIPVVESVSPAYLEPGATVTISGQFLQDATDVTIDGVSSSFVVIDDATIAAIAPPLDWGGPYQVVVTTPAGPSLDALRSTVSYYIVPSWATIVAVVPDPSVVTSQTIRNAIAASGYPWHVRTNDAFAFDMTLIPAGTFEMGCSASQQTNCEGNENPVHQVTITKPYYIGRCEVTQSQWNLVNEYRGWSYFDADEGYSDTGNYPAESMSWDVVCVGTQAYDRTTGDEVWVSSWLELAGGGYRLPTEAEWEYAYRGGTTGAYHGWPSLPYGTSDGTNSNVAIISWFEQSTPEDVGLKSPNGFGLYDMGGNVFEWVSDYFGDYPSDAQTDPTGPASGTERTIRGGDYSSSKGGCRASSRDKLSPTIDSKATGFRVVRDP